MSTNQKERRYDKTRIILGTIIASLSFFYCVYISFRGPVFTPAVALVYGLTLGLSALVLGGRLKIDTHPVFGMAIRATGGIAFLLIGITAAVIVIERFQAPRNVNGWLVDEDRIQEASERAIRIGAKNFAESNILAEIIAHHLREKKGGKPIEVLNSYGSSRAVMAALVTGDLDIYVEYTGTLLQHQLSLSPNWDERARKTCWKGCDESRIQSLLAEYQLPHWARLKTRIEPVVRLGFSSNYHIVITKELYNERKDKDGALKSRLLSHWIPNVLEDKRVGATEEFTRRKDGLLDLVAFYGGGIGNIDIKKFDDVDGKYSALKKSEVDWIAGFSTDPQMPDGCKGANDDQTEDSDQDASSEFVRLKDDKLFWPEYQAVALSRAGFLDKYPYIRSGLWEMRKVLRCRVIREAIVKSKEVDFLKLTVSGEANSAREQLQNMIQNIYERDVKPRLGDGTPGWSQFF